MKNGEPRPRTPLHLWIVGVLALLWNAVGAFDYTATKLQLEFYMSSFTEEQLAYFYGFPAWFTVFWAMAVWGALAGSLGLLLRKKWAVGAFIVSTVSMVVTTVYNFGLSNGMKVMGTFGAVFTAVIWAVALLLLWYSWRMCKRGVLR